MTPFTEFMRALLPSAQSQAERDEAYLAESQDLHDLERRMREIDARGRGHSLHPMPAGVFPVN